MSASQSATSATGQQRLDIQGVDIDALFKKPSPEILEMDRSGLVYPSGNLRDVWVGKLEGALLCADLFFRFGLAQLNADTEQHRQDSLKHLQPSGLRVHDEAAFNAERQRLHEVGERLRNERVVLETIRQRVCSALKKKMPISAEQCHGIRKGGEVVAFMPSR